MTTNDQPEPLDLRSHTIAEDKKQELLQLFPEIRTEGGKVDIDRLKMALGETVDVGRERYGMNWPGKADCFKTIQQPSMGTLLPCKEESVDFDTTENMIIEGDNLEVLKLLQKSYLGKVKMIYIDPPYNTGNDFIYPDNYTESLETYLEYTGQVDKEGRRFSTNTEADGRFHSKWMNMMYPRLFLARNLLKNDGVIFISIGDDEFDNTKKLCDEVFGSENFVMIFSRMMKSGGAKGRFYTPSIDYVVVYAKSIIETTEFRGCLNEEQIERFYNKVEAEGERKDELYGEDRIYKASLEPRPNQRYYILCPDGSYAIPPGVSFPEKVVEGEKVFPTAQDGVWKWIYSKYADEKAKGNIVFKNTKTSALVNEKGEKSPWNLYNKLWLSDQKEKGLVPSNFIEEFENRQSAAELKNLSIVFDYAKPSGLIKYLISISTSESDALILDFFAGSGSTAHAVLDINKKDSSRLKFILVQLPEPCETDGESYKAGFETIAEIAKERVRRVIKKIKDEEATRHPDAFDADKPTSDLGFKVFKLSESNFKTWNPSVTPGDTAALEHQLEMHIDHIRPGRSQDDILYEVLLKSGFPLSTKIETLTLAGKTVYSIAEGGMFICLERNLTQELIKAIADKKPMRVVCLDEGFTGNDQLKTNAVQTMKAKGVVSFRTV
jgi:adenine-specific DNA-methyltransferase